ncbi:MAG: DoxX family membrane protein [Cyclobacteriaceae bacterium]
MKWIVQIARILVGGLFIFSGLIKVNDPVGTAIKLEEYFEVFAYDFAPFFEWFVPLALILSVVLSVLEVVLGIALLSGFRSKLTVNTLLGMIVFFTFLTFYSAYFNKVTDCGCFGDAIKLTPWESFTKDIILLILILVLFIGKKHIEPLLKSGANNILVIGSTVLLTVVAVMAIRHLPYIDFRAYAVGNHLPSLMQPSEPLVYEYVMEKDGEEFIFDQYPSDPNFKFLEMNLVNPEAQPKITDLGIWTDEAEYTDELFVGNKLVIIYQNVEKADVESMRKIKQLANIPAVDSWILTSSGYEAFESFRHEHQLSIPYFYADATVLKTMVRSNPGILLLSDGYVLGKWHFNDAPSVEEVLEKL